MNLTELVTKLKQRKNFEFTEAKVKFKDDEIGDVNFINSMDDLFHVFLTDSINIIKVPLSSRILLLIKLYGGNVSISEQDSMNWNLKIYFKQQIEVITNFMIF